MLLSREWMFPALLGTMNTYSKWNFCFAVRQCWNSTFWSSYQNKVGLSWMLNLIRFDLPSDGTNVVSCISNNLRLFGSSLLNPGMHISNSMVPCEKINSFVLNMEAMKQLQSVITEKRKWVLVKRLKYQWYEKRRDKI